MSNPYNLHTVLMKRMILIDGCGESQNSITGLLYLLIIEDHRSKDDMDPAERTLVHFST